MPKVHHRVTLKQVAAHAGVSYQTVSKVINKKAQVSPETEARIWKAVKALGYHPNHIARSLRSQRSMMIGYSWAPSPPDQVNPVLDQFLQSMFCAAEEAGYYLLSFPHHMGHRQIQAYQELVDTNRVDAFVISGVEYDDPRITFLLDRKFPFVAFGRSNPDWDFPYVDVDGGEGMRMVVKYLAGLGHRRIAALAWPEDSRVGNNRMHGFLEALAEVGITPLPEWLSRGEGRYLFGLQATNELLDLPAERQPTAIVAFNDAMAIGAMRAAHEKGMQVGVNLAITGFDDAPLVQYLTPPLTSVRQPVWEVGQRVISMLLTILDGKEPEERHVLLPPELIVRQSCSQAGDL